jgi:hypothetical protein
MHKSAYLGYHSPRPDIAAEKVRTSCRKRRVSGLGAMGPLPSREGAGPRDERGWSLSEVAHLAHKRTHQSGNAAWGCAKNDSRQRCLGMPTKPGVTSHPFHKIGKTELAGKVILVSIRGMETPINDRQTDQGDYILS